MEQDIYAVVARKLKEHRKRLGLTQEVLSEKVGLHPSYIGMIERGTRKTSLLTIQKLSEALGIKIRDLLEEGLIYRKTSNVESKIAAFVRDKPRNEQEFIYNGCSPLTPKHPND